MWFPVLVLYSFLRLNSLPLHGYITLFIHASVHGHLGCSPCALVVVVPDLSSLGVESRVILPQRAQCPSPAWYGPGRGSVGTY